MRFLGAVRSSWYTSTRATSSRMAVVTTMPFGHGGARSASAATNGTATAPPTAHDDRPRNSSRICLKPVSPSAIASSRLADRHHLAVLEVGEAQAAVARGAVRPPCPVEVVARDLQEHAIDGLTPPVAVGGVVGIEVLRLAELVEEHRDEDDTAVARIGGDLHPDLT